MVMHITDLIRRKFSMAAPLFFASDTETVKLEMKPYLQPFERELATRELRAMLAPEDSVTEAYGFHVVRTKTCEEVLRKRLAYWQRVGRTILEPTLQECLEFTQNGVTKTYVSEDLHNARRLRYGPHDLHEYRGKFFPQLVRSLMNISGVGEDAIVLDPMCGSGTTTCEALASGRSAMGVDLNPLSVLIARVKSAVVRERPEVFSDTVTKDLKRFRFKTVRPENLWSEHDLKYLSRWFAPAALRDLAGLLADIRGVEKALYRDLYKVCLSNIIRSVSWQKDADLRVRKEVRSYDSGEARDRFKREVLRQIDRIFPYLSVLPRTSRHPFLAIRKGDAIRVHEIFPGYRRKVGLLITSPPYATALPYLDTDRLSLIVLGLLPRSEHKRIETSMIGTREITQDMRRRAWEQYLRRKSELPMRVSMLIDELAEHNHREEVGFRRRNLPALLGRYFLAMLDAMRSAHTLMKPGARGYYVVGNNSTVVDGKKIEIPTDEFLFEIGAAAGWKPDETISMDLPVSRDIFRGNRGSAETILCFTA